MEKPILFNTPMVQAILDGRKTQTRRIVSEGNLIGLEGMKKAHRTELTDQELLTKFASKPYYKGDILWVRETWGDYRESSEDGEGYYTLYRADYPEGAKTYKAGEDEFGKEIICDLPKWHPSIHMPKEAARIFLHVTDVRAERLQEISGEDCVREGVDKDALKEIGSEFARGIFSGIWDDTVKPEERARCGWDANPWVWVYTFERTKR